MEPRELLHTIGQGLVDRQLLDTGWPSVMTVLGSAAGFEVIIDGLAFSVTVERTPQHDASEWMKPPYEGGQLPVLKLREEPSA
jgi:hypothetical protein